MKQAKVTGIAALVLFTAALSGCASTGPTQPGTAPASKWNATGPNTAVIETPSANQPVVKADTEGNFDAVVAAVRKQMQPGGRWQYLDANDRVTINGSFADMKRLFEQYGSVDKMDKAAQRRLVYDQTTVNTILTKRDGDRIICHSIVPIGSHLPVKTCTTYAEIQAQEQRAQQQLRNRNAQQLQMYNTQSLSH